MHDSPISTLKAHFDPANSTPIRRLALVGVAKNCGKTTTLNFLRRSSALAGRVVGMVSVGIDGEVADALLGTEKPAIWAAPGDWVVTAQDVLIKSSARVEYVERLGFSTPLGEVICARVVEAGTVILAGLRHRADLIRACEILEACGVDLVLIDGAYARTMAASGGVSDAVIVSTGAVLSDDIDQIEARTAALLDRLSIPSIQADWQQALMRQAIVEERFLLGGEFIDPVGASASSALIGLQTSEALWTPQMSAIAIPGLVSDGVAETLLGGWPRPEDDLPYLLIPDGTVLQARSHLLKRLARRWKLRALKSARIIALSVNPTGIQGHIVDSDELRRRLHTRWPDLLIFDPLNSVHTSVD